MAQGSPLCLERLQASACLIRSIVKIKFHFDIFNGGTDAEKGKRTSGTLARERSKP